MAEFLKEAEVQSVASAEYQRTKNTLEEINLIVEDLENRLVAKNEKITEADFKLLYGYIDVLTDDSHDVIVRLLKNKHKATDDEVVTFRRYVTRRLYKSLERVQKLRVEYNAASDAIVLDALQISTFFSQFLELQATLYQEKEGGSTDFAAHREEFRGLKIHPTGFFIEQAQQKLADLATEYPGVIDNKSLYQDVATLTKDETDELGSLIIDKLGKGADPTLIDRMTKWIVDNPDALANLLKLTQSYEGNEPGDAAVPEGALKLQESLRALLEEKARLVKEKKIAPSINENKPLDDYNLKEDRVREILFIIDLVSYPELIPQFTRWQADVIQEYTIYIDGEPERPYKQFLQDFKKKLDTNSPIDDAVETPALRRVLAFLRNQQNIVSVVEYPVSDPDSQFNKNLQSAKIKYLETEIARVQELIERQDQKAGRSKAESAKDESELAKQEVTRLIYTKLKERNPYMPDFLEMSEYVKKHGLNAFMTEFILGLTNYLGSEVFSASVASGQQVFALPADDVKLWQLKFNIPSREMDVNKTVDTLITDFPWAEIMSGASHETILEWVTMWKYRILHIEAMHNYVNAMRETGNWQSGDNPMAIVKLVGDEKQDTGGYYNWDLGPFYKQVHRKGADGEVETELHKLFEKDGGRETYWRIPDYVNHFIGGIEREIPDLVFLSRRDKSTEIQQVRDKLIEEIPAGIRVKDPKKPGEFRDGSVVDLAWKIATWTSIFTLRNFDYDDDGLDSKLAWYINTGEYATKVAHTRMNTDYEWRDTGLDQVSRIWPTRSDFIHMYVELSPDKYESYTLEQVIEERNDMRTKAKALKVGDAKRQTLERRIAQITKFIIESRQFAVGEYEDLSSLEQIQDIKRRIAALESLKSKKTNIDQEEIDRLTDLVDTLEAEQPLIRSSLEAAHPKAKKSEIDEMVLDELKRIAQNMAVNSRYKIIRVKPEHAAMYDPANPKDISEMMFIRVPRNYLKHARRQAIKNRNPDRAHMIALSDRQIVDSMVDPQYVRFDTMTAQHGRFWAGAASDGKVWMEFLSTRDTKAVFPPIHETHLAKNNIHKRTVKSDFPEDIKDLWRKFRTLRSSPESLAAEAVRIDEVFRKKVVITHMTIDDLSKKEGGMGFSKITQAGARYYSDKISTGAGPRLPGEDVLPVSELLLNVFRKPFRGMVEDPHGHGEVEGTIRELRNRYPDSKDLRAAKTKAVPEGVRIAADLIGSVDDEGKPLHAAGQSQFVVEAWLIAVGLYLDQYRYKSVEGGHSVHYMTGMLETVRHEIETISGAKPMDFAHRELFLEMCDMALESFLGPDFGGDMEEQKNLSKKIVRAYARDAVEQMMRDRGLVGTVEQFVVDTHYYEHDWKKIGEVAEGDKKNGH
ncbi:hypothetical protein H3C66_00160 [Patescibacteria group bacterium]|nr:hypothetical protein [Patescibacteria group bacterium]